MGGALAHAWALQFAMLVSTPGAAGPNAPAPPWAAAFAHRPLLTADSVLGRTLPLYRDFVTHSTLDSYWNRLRFDAKDFAAIGIPTLTVTGAYDGDQPGSLFYWRGVMAHAPNRDQHFLIVGPWRHPETFRGGSRKVGEIEASAESIVDMKALHLSFFDWCVKRETRLFESPRARIFVTGANTWRAFDQYPPPTVTPRSLYLTSGGRANSSGGNGRLGWNPGATSRADTFTYDPKNPVPDEFENWGTDRAPTQRRNDVLVYTSDVLEQPVEVVGSVTVDLRASTDARDTDFTAVLSDVHADGRALKLGPAVGIRRGRYRNGYEREVLLTPGKIEQYRIELFDLAHRFEPGHRIRLEISSSAAGIYTPNQNTGNPVATDTDWTVARQVVYHDRANPSAILLPVIVAPGAR